MAKKGSLGKLVAAFFEQYLSHELGCSGNTIASYSACIKLLLQFCCQHLNRSIDRLTIKEIDAQTILAFLDHLETQRENLPQTRNARLACIHTFFRFVALQEPAMLEVCRRICAIKPKKVSHRALPSLTCQQVDAILEAVEPNDLWGLRDHALLLLLYNTGARVSEIVHLKIDDLRLEAPSQVLLTGKGNKQRSVLLWQETAQAIKRYLDFRNQHYDQRALIINTRGLPISRFGIGHIVRKYHQLAERKCPSLREIKVTPHSFRHACALHNIEAGNAITDVQAQLGHASIATTQVYLTISLEMKKKALAVFAPPRHASSSGSVPLRWCKPGILDYLDKLCHPAGAGTQARPRSGP